LRGNCDLLSLFFASSFHLYARGDAGALAITLDSPEAGSSQRGGGAENFRRIFFFVDGFPSLTGENWEHGLFGEISSHQSANPLAGIRAPA
jgi:hypothetical protein